MTGLLSGAPIRELDSEFIFMSDRNDPMTKKSAFICANLRLPTIALATVGLVYSYFSAPFHHLSASSATPRFPLLPETEGIELGSKFIERLRLFVVPLETMDITRELVDHRMARGLLH